MISNNWHVFQLKEVLSKTIDNRGKTPPTQADGYELLEVNAISATDKYPIYEDVRKHVSQEVYNNNFRSGHPKIGDILIPTVGTLGAVSYVNKEGCCIAQNLIAIRGNNKIIDSNFLYYTLRNPVTRTELLNLDIGGVQPSIKVPHLLELKIKVPELSEQQRIASILSSLDDKIELNQRQNNNLEQQAQALILEFIQHTDQEVPLGDLITFTNGFAFKSTDYLISGKYKIITIKNVQDGKVDSQGASQLDELPNRLPNDCCLSVGDVLLSLTGNVGRVGIVTEENLLLNQRVAKLNVKETAFLPFLYFYMRLPSMKTEMENISKGTAQQNLSPVETLKLKIPFEKEKIISVSKTLSSFFDQIVYNFIQNRKLSALRDALLPKLMSGEIDVSQVDISALASTDKLSFSGE